MNDKSYIELQDLEVYRLSREYSQLAWESYGLLDWQLRKIIGDQMITSVDSVGANIAEGYGRFHFLDKIKFFYNARGSLLESGHWFGLLFERRVIDRDKFSLFKKLRKEILLKINLFIKSQHSSKNNLIS